MTDFRCKAKRSEKNVSPDSVVHECVQHFNPRTCHFVRVAQRFRHNTSGKRVPTTASRRVKPHGFVRSVRSARPYANNGRSCFCWRAKCTILHRDRLSGQLVLQNRSKWVQIRARNFDSSFLLFSSNVKYTIEQRHGNARATVLLTLHEDAVCHSLKVVARSHAEWHSVSMCI